MGKALLSVSDKNGIDDFAKQLLDRGFEIYSSGGTAKYLAARGIQVTDVAMVTGEPARLEHRVVTLHPKVHGGLLSTPTMAKELKDLEWPRWDLVCVDLYPFENVVASGAEDEEANNNLDMGGIALIRSGGKGRRITISKPEQRQMVIEWLDAGRPDEETFCRALQAEAEFVSFRYCMAAAEYFSNGRFAGLALEKVEDLKYGENPWQTPSAYYEIAGNYYPLAIHRFEQIAGTAKSYVNVKDMHRLVQLISHINAALNQNFGQTMFIAVAVKHGNACGVGVAKDPDTAIKMMIDGNRTSIHGGAVMTNFAITEELGKFLLRYGMGEGERRILDLIGAPGFDEASVSMLERYKDKCRFLVNPALTDPSLDCQPFYSYAAGGYCKQPNYTLVPNFGDEQFVKYGPVVNGNQLKALVIAWAIGSVSNSNTISIVGYRTDGSFYLAGNGVGQTARVFAGDLASYYVRNGGHQDGQLVAYSDSFCPFVDAVEVLDHKCNIEALLTSSGAKNDQDIIDYCVASGIILLMAPDALIRGFANH